MAEERVTNFIRRLRFENGEMTQQALADRVGVTRQTIIAVEAGKYMPSLPLAFKLARSFGMGVEEVFQLEGPPGQTPESKEE
jgi:putative transcriptional regulator